MALAQRARGVQGFDKGIVSRMKSYASLIVPLLEGSLRHAERLAIAMDTRCYAAAPHRTHLRPLRLVGSDYLACVCVGALALAFFVIRLFG
ncbi:MAG: energy-coupling factor transporter transmembrane component T [Gordonibacter sp.]|nr:energy-coupling factor transporter transmembrane component T [Gordonibacter sp.]